MSDIDPDYAARVLQAVLGQPGGGQTVIVQLGGLPGAEYVPPQPKRFLRPAVPGRLVLGDQDFHTPHDTGTQLQVSHIVRGVALQTRSLGPAEAADALVAGLRQLIEAGGTDVPDAVAAALYGLEVAAGPG